MLNPPFAAEDAKAAPCVQALVAGTVALMTTWADPCVGCRLDVAQQRTLLARKVVSNLFFLQHHPNLSPELRLVMARAHKRWLLLACPPAAVDICIDPSTAATSASRRMSIH